METFDGFAKLLRAGGMLMLLQFLLEYEYQTPSRNGLAMLDGSMATALFGATYLVLCAPVLMSSKNTQEVKEKHSRHMCNMMQGVLRLTWLLSLAAFRSWFLFALIQLVTTGVVVGLLLLVTGYQLRSKRRLQVLQSSAMP
jgi:hypothetical protein